MRPLMTLSLLVLWACGTPTDPVDGPDPTSAEPTSPTPPTPPTDEPPTGDPAVRLLSVVPDALPPRVLTAVTRCVDSAWEVEAEVLGLPDAEVTIVTAEGEATASLSLLDSSADAVFRRAFAAVSGLSCTLGDSASVVIEVVDADGRASDCLALGPDAVALAESHAPCHAR